MSSFCSMMQYEMSKCYDKNGENNPYSVTFIFKTGFETEEKCKTKKNKSEDEKMCYYTEDDTRGRDNSDDA